MKNIQRIELQNPLIQQQQSEEYKGKRFTYDKKNLIYFKRVESDQNPIEREKQQSKGKEEEDNNRGFPFIMSNQNSTKNNKGMLSN